MQFKIIHQSERSRARLGQLTTFHGVVETPALVPVATQASVKTLTSEQVETTNTQLLIANTFHLHVRPGEDLVAAAGGVHTFMHWPRPLMTDSGGFQVFSLGFGRDLGVGKMLKFFPGDDAHPSVKAGSQPQDVKITDEGVHFRSPLNGQKLFLGPKESIAIQNKLGADIIFAFDECTPPLASRSYAEAALKRTHVWAKLCRDVHAGPQALFGIIQGSHWPDLREQSARYITALDFPGYGIGGDLGASKKEMNDIISWVIPHLEPNKPRHLLGIGQLEDMKAIIAAGIDMFDCTVPTHYARHGTVFTSQGKISITAARFQRDFTPLDVTCECSTCQHHTKAYLAHLMRAKELTGLTLLTIHNLTYFNRTVAALREQIRNGTL